MADINVERKSPSIWPWIIGLLVLALLIWAVAEMVDTEEPEVATADQTEVAEEMQPLPQPAGPAGAAGMSLAQILDEPDRFAGQNVTVEGQVDVTETPGDRTFFISDGGQRALVILKDQPAEQPLDINPGQRVRLTQVQVLTKDNLDQVTDLSQEDRDLAEGEDAILVVDESNVEITQGGTSETGTAGTTPGQASTNQQR